VVQYMWSGQGTVFNSVYGLDREESGTVYVDRTVYSVVQYM